MDEEIVSVPVPRSRLREVYALLAADPDERVGASPAYPKPWDFESISDLWAGSDRSPALFLRHLAAHPDEEVGIEEIKELLGGKSGRAIGGMIGALQRRCRNHFHREIPFEKRWDPARGMRYVMPAQIAEMVTEVR